MNLADTITHAGRLLADAAHYVNDRNPRDHMTVPERIRESFNGWPSGSGFDRSPRRSTDHDGDPLPTWSDPTGDAGIRADRARDDLHHIERDITAAVRSLQNAVDRLARYELRKPNVLEQQETAEVEPGCVSCARIPGPSNTAAWFNYRTHGDLCRWCAEHRPEPGKFPNLKDLAAHRDGKRVRRPVG